MESEREKIYHKDSEINRGIIDILRDLEKQREGYRNGDEVIEPIGRLDLKGRMYRDEVMDAIRENRNEFCISSIESMGDKSIIMFTSGKRYYSIGLDGMFSKSLQANS